MLMPLNHVLHENSPPGRASLALAMVTGGLVGLAVIPLAAVLLALAVAVFAMQRAGRAVLRWLNWTPPLPVGKTECLWDRLSIRTDEEATATTLTRPSAWDRPVERITSESDAPAAPSEAGNR